MSKGTLQRRVQVARLSKISGDVYQVILRAIDDAPLEWAAGQYLEIVMPEGNPCAYSIGSAQDAGSQEPASLELHIQRIPGHKRAREVIDHLKTAPEILVNIPKGNCHLGDCPDTALVFIAAGTGFSQMKSMIEQTIASGHPHPVSLYWGVRHSSGFYMPSLPVYWASEKGVKYHPVVSDPEGDSDWHGRYGLLYQAVLDDKQSLPGAHFYISGSPDMVYSTLDELVAAGFPKEHIHSDVFDYCPR